MCSIAFSGRLLVVNLVSKEKRGLLANTTSSCSSDTAERESCVVVVVVPPSPAKKKKKKVATMIKTLSFAFHARLSRSRTLFDPYCASVESQPIGQAWTNPVVFVAAGIMESSHDCVCCQGCDLWQGKKDSLTYQRDQVLNPSRHCEFALQFLSEFVELQRNFGVAWKSPLSMKPICKPSSACPWQ